MTKGKNLYKRSNNAKGLQPNAITVECVFEVYGQRVAVALGGTVVESAGRRAEEGQQAAAAAAAAAAATATAAISAAKRAFQIVGDSCWHLGFHLEVCTCAASNTLCV